MCLMKRSAYMLVMLFLVFSCKEPEARKPKTNSVTSFYKEVIAESKKLNALENKKIQYFITNDTIYNYKSSSNGFWYAYLHKDSISTVTPKQNDLVTIEYDVKTLTDKIIYQKQKITYKVDKQDFIPGLREGLKLMKEGEEAVFIIPSYTAYGVTGDGHKIKINQPIKSVLKLIQIKNNNNENN